MSNIQSAPSEHDQFLRYRNCEVRIVVKDGVLLFAVPDIAAAIGLSSYPARVLRDLPASMKAVCYEETDEGFVDQDMLNSVGVWLFGHEIDPARSQSVAAWAKREALRLCPDATPDNPAIFLTVQNGEPLPPRPYRYSGRYAEWDSLRFSDEYMGAKLAYLYNCATPKALLEAAANG